jgi:hypothetical protein
MGIADWVVFLWRIDVDGGFRRSRKGETTKESSGQDILMPGHNSKKGSLSEFAFALGRRKVLAVCVLGTFQRR